jgi:hypothetical protein
MIQTSYLINMEQKWELLICLFKKSIC